MDWLTNFIICLLYEACLEGDASAWVHGKGIDILREAAFWAERELYYN